MAILQGLYIAIISQIRLVVVFLLRYFSIRIFLYLKIDALNKNKSIFLIINLSYYSLIHSLIRDLR